MNYSFKVLVSKVALAAVVALAPVAVNAEAPLRGYYELALQKTINSWVEDFGYRSNHPVIQEMRTLYGLHAPASNSPFLGMELPEGSPFVPADITAKEVFVPTSIKEIVIQRYWVEISNACIVGMANEYKGSIRGSDPYYYMDWVVSQCFPGAMDNFKVQNGWQDLPSWTVVMPGVPFSDLSEAAVMELLPPVSQAPQAKVILAALTDEPTFKYREETWQAQTAYTAIDRAQSCTRALGRLDDILSQQAASANPVAQLLNTQSSVSPSTSPVLAIADPAELAVLSDYGEPVVWSEQWDLTIEQAAVLTAVNNCEKGRPLPVRASNDFERQNGWEQYANAPRGQPALVIPKGMKFSGLAVTMQ